MRTNYSKLTGKEVITDMGLYLGNLQDVDIDAKTGRIKALLIAPRIEDEGGLFFKKRRPTAKEAIIKRIPKTKDGLLIIPGNAIKSTQELIVIDTHRFSKILT